MSAIPAQHFVDGSGIVPGMTEADLAGTGYHLRRSKAHTFAPSDALQSVRLKATGIAGELQILMSTVLRGAFYEAESTFDPVNRPWKMDPAFNGMALAGLTRGKDYFVRVRVVATSANRGPWSDIANAMAM